MSESVVDEPFACPNCGKSSDEHPTMDVSNAKTIFLCQDRAAKWRRVEPGTVIPAGQPYAVKPLMPTRMTWMEYGQGCPEETTADDRYEWFADSSWKPPLVLPTEATWGIAVHQKYGVVMECWHLDAGEDLVNSRGGSYRVHFITDFIPLTDEQVARIEAGR